MTARLINLRLFDGEGGAGSGAATAGSQTTGTTTATSETQGSAVAQRSKKKAGAFDSVVFGKQEDTTVSPKGPVAEDTAGVQQSPEERKAAFAKMLEDYKDLDVERTNGIINRRFKEVKTLEENLAKVSPITELLMQKYGVDSEDKLLAAIENDNDMWEQEAEKANMTVEQYKTFKKLEQDNQIKTQQLEAQRQEDEARQRVQQWVREADELTQRFPSFDLRAEMENPEFVKLLERGIPVEHAFRVTHFEELTTGIAAIAGKEAQKETAAALKSKQSRPKENGSGQTSGVVVKSDVHTLTKAERAEIVRRAQRGDTIRFD